MTSTTPLPISELWCSVNPEEWELALEHYWQINSARRNLPLEISLEQPLTLMGRLRRLDAQEWYDFLHDEYFRWKYTSPNRYASTTKLLQTYKEKHLLDTLDQVRQRLLTLDTEDTWSALEVAGRIKGLGPPGASGLLALMYPQKFGTIDQFAVKALQKIESLPEASAISRMRPEALTISDGVVIITILRRKADENNRVFKTDRWTPRKIDKVLWAVGR